MRVVFRAHCLFQDQAALTNEIGLVFYGRRDLAGTFFHYRPVLPLGDLHVARGNIELKQDVAHLIWQRRRPPSSCLTPQSLVGGLR